MEVPMKRFRNISSIESAALTAIAACVNPSDIFSDLHSAFAVESHFDAEGQGPEYENAIRTLVEGCGFVTELISSDWGGSADLKVQPAHALESRCDRVREQFPGDLSPFLTGTFLCHDRSDWGFEGLIVRLAQLHDSLPKYDQSQRMNEWEENRDRAVKAIYRHLSEEIAEAERVLAELLKPPFDYHAYLRSPEWKAKRDAQVEAAGGRCQVCNSPKQLNCHHRTYDRIGNEIPDDLFVLCADCHQIFHDNGKLARPDAK